MEKLYGQLLIIASAICFGVAPLFMSLSYGYGGNPINTSFYSSLITIPLFCLLLIKEKISIKVDKPTLLRLGILSLCGNAAVTILVMYSYSLIPVGMAITLHFIYPVVVAFALIVFFKDKLTSPKIIALVASVGGVTIMSMGSGRVNSLGLVLALASGFLWAFYIVYMDKSGLSTLSVYLLGLYASVFTVLASGIVGLCTHSLQPLTDGRGWLFMLGSALLARMFAQPLFQIGIRKAGSFSAGVLSTFEPITSVVLGILILNESSSPGKILGCALVVLGACTVVYSDVRVGTSG